MRERDTLEPDQVRPRDRIEEALPMRRPPTQLFRLGMKMLGVIASGFRITEWVIDRFG